MLHYHSLLTHASVLTALIVLEFFNQSIASFMYAEDSQDSAPNLGNHSPLEPDILTLESINSDNDTSDSKPAEPEQIFPLFGNFERASQSASQSGELEVLIQRNSISSRASSGTVLSPGKKPIFYNNKTAAIVIEDSDHLIPVYNLSQACAILDSTNGQTLCARIYQSIHDVKSRNVSNAFYLCDAFLQLLTQFRVIITRITEYVEYLKQYNNIISHFFKIRERVPLEYYKSISQSRFDHFAKKIYAWKHAYLYLAAEFSGLDINDLKYGFQIGTLILSQKNEQNNPQFEFGLQLDCINYIFRRHLYQIASEYNRYRRLDGYMFASKLNPVRISNTDQSSYNMSIGYFGGSWYKSALSQLASWIQKVFENSNVFEPECMDLAMEQNKYNHIETLHPGCLVEWIIYTLRFDSRCQHTKEEIRYLLKESVSQSNPKNFSTTRPKRKLRVYKFAEPRCPCCV